MYWEAMRTPALPGEYDVTDGSVDYYDTCLLYTSLLLRKKRSIRRTIVWTKPAAAP